MTTLSAHVLLSLVQTRTLLLTVLWFLICIICWCEAQSPCELITNGGILTRSVTLNSWDGPCVIQKDLIVAQKCTLTLNAGVVLKFNPGRMLAVNGTLLSKGEPGNRVVLTKNAVAPIPSHLFVPVDNNVTDTPVAAWPHDIRLVDDFSVDRGRLQVYYKSKWRGICANFQNWTQVDVDVACKQLGFNTGNFSFVSWATNDTAYMLYHRPACIGTETNILSCPTNSNIRIGSRICKQQQTIHLRCYGLSVSSPALDNWSGLEFYNTTALPSVTGINMINESTSILQYTDILWAGVGDGRQYGIGLYPIPAIRASPYVPALVNVTIKYCALDGTNFTNVKSSTRVTASHISDNRGHGLVVETNLGHVTITNSLIGGNYGNGIKAKFLDGRFPLFDDQLTFCKMANLDRQTFPQTIIGIPSLSNNCGRKFETQFGYRLTLNVLEFDIEPDATAKLEVYDGNSPNSPLLAVHNIVNGSLPMGVTSTFQYMYILFTWNYKPQYTCLTLRDCVKFTILIDSSPESKPEFFMNNTVVVDNLQHGVYLENLRNYVFINASHVASNGYGAGIRVYGGAGDIVVNASRVEFNQDNGVNITYDGGWKIFNQSSFSHNFGNGINITINETSVDNKTRYTRHQRTEVSRSIFISNDGFGIRVGNYCRSGHAIVNDSSFISNARTAVEMESCFQIVPDSNSTNFTIAYNRFDSNAEHAIKISPILNCVGTIANNTFTNHPKYVLLLDNTDDYVLNDEVFRHLRVQYSMITNRFIANRGLYVASLRLTQGAPRQRMDISYNIFQENAIEGANPTLNERTRAYSVVVLSSSNINFTRNHLENPTSRYELATYLLEMSVTLQATRQWWGTTDYQLIVPRIFDQFSRYNLARISYHPALAYDWLYTPVLTDRNIEIEVPFVRGNNLGGRLSTVLTLVSGTTYTVDRDVSVLGYGKLIVPAGVTLEFRNCLGALVEGEVQFVGDSSRNIHLRLSNESTWVNNSLIRLVGGGSGMAEEDGGWDGAVLEGKLEVRPTENDTWGTVCSEGWTMFDASVACQMMGLAVHPSTWRVRDSQLLISSSADPNQPIYRSQVQCTSLDRDLLTCIGEDENSHSCTHSQDVYLRCVRPTWAGVRFLANARSSRLSYVTLMGAGLMDPAAILYSPAIRIDYHVHSLDHLVIANNSADGLTIIHNDVYSTAKLSDSVVKNNFGNGVSVRSSFFELYNCTLDNNRNTGFEYNPTLSALDSIQLRAGIKDSFRFDTTTSIKLANYEVRWVTTPEQYMPGTNTLDLEIEVNQLFKVVMDIVDYNPSQSQESILVYDTRKSSIQSTTTRWSIDQDIMDFPIVSQLTIITVRWTVVNLSSGRFTFVLRSRPYDWQFPFPVLRITNSTLSNNAHGIITRHYSQPSDFFLGLFHRYHWETIRLFGTTLRGNLYSAFRVSSETKFSSLYLPTYEDLQSSPVRICEITFEVEACTIAENGGGVSAYHNPVEYSNNVWIWKVGSNRFEGNRGGGFTLDLPRVNLMYTELYNHSIDINDTHFINNNNFELRIDGFYCNASISRNRFQGNQCKLGCVTIAGTEKDFELNDNEVVENIGQYMIELHMNSHTPYTRWVDARLQYNNIKRNRRPDKLPASTTGGKAVPIPLGGMSSLTMSYAVGVRGLQNVTLNKNLFNNRDGLDFELLSGQSSSMLENYLDVTENWWGTAEQDLIRERIFDFDDWNSYSIAEYFPYLTSDSFSARPFVGAKYRQILDLSQPLGGRITENLRLKRQAAPYIVRRDLTVMRDYSLIIEAGVEIQFFPNVGILVLGSLVAEGTALNRIKFSPVSHAIYSNSSLSRTSRSILRDFPDRSVARPKRQLKTSSGRTAAVRILHPNVNAQLGYEVRLIGGGNSDEGFLEIYNVTERRWALICDKSFNEFTAEVTCRTMNKEPSNAIVRRNRYFDIYVYGYPKMHEQVIEWFWRETLICDGRESALDQCRYQLNYNLYDCMENRDYVFVRCGARNLPPDLNYWGNIRFSSHNYENAEITPGYNVLNYVDIYGAGRLHDDKVAAVQSIYRVPDSSNVRVHHSASNGYDYIAPRDQFSILHNSIENNNGYAVGALVLNGESSEQSESQFTPLEKSGVPYNVYGLVRMCTTEKLIYIKDRALLYHKYSFETIDCIKVLRSKEPMKQIAVRFLQVNMYNDSYYRNAVEMYNGEFFDYRQLIGQISPNSTLLERKLQYRTSIHYDTMGIRITGSPADGNYGFIAEIVTLPLSPSWRPDLGGGRQQRIAYTSMTDNQGGGFVFKNVGENNPRVTIESNHIERCGIVILNNTEPGVIDIYIQNTRLLTIANNYIAHNAAGISVNTTTKDNEVALYANITNNVITYCSNGEALHLEGHQYQGFDVRYNYLAYNDVAYRNVFGAFGVQLNFTSNIVFKNMAQCIINASVLEKISINQRYIRNSIHDNYAFAYNRSTIFLKSAKFEFSYNYLLNPYNLYEMVTYNRTKYPDGTYPSVEARNNWWGRNHVSYVAGRIWERRDDDNLIRVEYEPFITDNATILDGKCYPGWRQFESKCYWYFGGVSKYSQAESACRANHGRLAWARNPKGRERELGELIAQFQFNYDVSWRVWVFTDWQNSDKLCPMIRDSRVEHENCDTLLPFICERDPFIQPRMNWLPIIITLVISLCVIAFILIPLLVFNCIKCTHRRQEKAERIQRSLHASKCSLNSLGGGAGRNALHASKLSLHASKCSLNSLGGRDAYGGSRSMLSEDLKKRRPPMNADMSMELKDLTLDESNADDSCVKPMYPAFNHRRPSDSSLEKEGRSTWGGDSASNYAESDLGPYRRGGYEDGRPPRIENEIPRVGRPLMRRDFSDEEEGEGEEVEEEEEEGGVDLDEQEEEQDDMATVASFVGDLSHRFVLPPSAALRSEPRASPVPSRPQQQSQQPRPFVGADSSYRTITPEPQYTPSATPRTKALKPPRPN